jgi:WD40 repeat protein
MQGALIPLLFGQSEFNPSELAGLKLWLDAGMINQSDGSSVVVWNDKSGNNANFSVNATTNQPTFQTNEINSKPVIRFDGTDDYLELVYPFDRRPNVAMNGVSFHPNGNFLAVTASTSSPFLWLYQRNGETFQYLSSAVSTQPTGTARQVRWSPNGNYLAVAHSTSPYFSVYKFDSVNKTLTKIANPTTLPVGAGADVCWTSDSLQLFVASNSGTGNRLLTYTLNPSTDVLTNQSNGQIQSNTVTGISITPDDGHFAVVYSNASPRIELYTYNKTTYQLTSLGASQPNIVPTGAAERCVFSPDGQFLAVTHASSPFVSVYYRSGTTYTKLANPTSLPASTGIGVAWSSDSKYLIVGTSGTIATIAYEKTGTGTGSTLTKLSTPDQLTIPSVNAITFGASDAYVAMATSTGQFLQIYSHSVGTFTTVTKHEIFRNVSGSTTFVVYKEDVFPATSQNLFNVSTGTSTTNLRLGQLITTTGFLAVQGRTGDNDTTAVSTNAAPYYAVGTHIVTGLFTNSTGTITSYIDGVQSKVESGFTGLTSGSTSNTDSRVFYLGRSLSTAYSALDIAEIISYNRALSSGEIAQVHNFLQAKYSIIDPRQFNGLQVWLDASTVNQADGTAITSWADLSGNGYNYTQATTTNQPTYKTNIQNGLGVVRFDGVDDYLSTTASAITQNVAGLTLIAVIKYNSSATQKTAVHFMRGTGTSGARATLVSTGSNIYSTGGRRLDSEGTQSVNSTSSSGAFAIQTGVFDFAGTTLNQYINGAVQGTSSSFQTAGNTSNTASLASYIGASSVTPTEFLTGDVCEVIVYNRALTSTELNKIHQHLGRKWGITLA